MAETSTKPYLLRAIYEWCTDNGYTPYIAARVDDKTRVPHEFVKDGEIVLNISFNATSDLKMDNDAVHFYARFGGIVRDIMVPIENVAAIYARENGQGMAFEIGTATMLESDKTEVTESPQPVEPTASPGLSSVPTSTPEHGPDNAGTDPDSTPTPPKKNGGGRPTLTRIK
ncbi:MAG: sspB [Herminiimonas sp.]|nr:sspB [Herminiimonas sp.]